MLQVILILKWIDFTSSESIASIADVILEDFFEPVGNPSLCGDPGNTEVKFDGIDFTVNRNRWSNHAEYEEDLFLAEMRHEDDDPNKAWTARFGTGGNIYSFYGVYGEAIPPQATEQSAFNDEVLQMVAVDTAKLLNSQSAENAYGGDWFIHQAGTYIFSTKKDDKPDPNEIPPPFFSPNVGKYCFGNTCRFASWGAQAHIPTSHRSDVLFFNEYRNCGSGVLQYTQSVHYMGDTIDITSRQYYTNIPWTGVRTTSLPDLMLSNSDGTLADKVNPLPTYQEMVAQYSIIPISSTGGFTTFAKTGKFTDIGGEPNVPCVTSSSSSTVSCSTANSFRLPFKVNGGCTKIDRSKRGDNLYYANCNVSIENFSFISFTFY